MYSNKLLLNYTSVLFLSACATSSFPAASVGLVAGVDRTAEGATDVVYAPARFVADGSAYTPGDTRQL